MPRPPKVMYLFEYGSSPRYGCGMIVARSERQAGGLYREQYGNYERRLRKMRRVPDGRKILAGSHEHPDGVLITAKEFAAGYSRPAFVTDYEE